MEAEAWLTGLQVAIGDQGEHGGARSGVEVVSDEEREALLDLARVAAHTSERWTAPISTYLVGLALAEVDPADRAARLRGLVADLE